MRILRDFVLGQKPTDFADLSWRIHQQQDATVSRSNRIPPHRGKMITRTVVWTSTTMQPSSPARICGLTMAVFVYSGEHVLHVVPHVSAELEKGRPGLHQAPGLERALGHPEQLGELALG